jgi:16S rRNA (guanine1207-N2)-methyltransferase
LRLAGWREFEAPWQERWDEIVLYAGKHKEENWALLEAANGLMTENAKTLFVVPNEYGSKSYQRRLQDEGRLLDYESGRKSRLYRLRRVASEATLQPLDALRRNAAGYWSSPGLFSWNEVDRGSALLAEALKGEVLKGPIGDLGAGWGYLGTALDGKQHLHLFESDRRGLAAAQKNLEGRAVTGHWCDLTDTEHWPPGAPTTLGTVISNPPFHAGKRQEAALGQLFARLAHRLLPPGGAFWLVGNTHLGYPRLLATLFGAVDVRLQKDGFTVVKAHK